MTSLKFTLPLLYLNPIKDALTGCFRDVLLIFKITKPKTDIVKEVKIQNEQGNEEKVIEPPHIQIDFKQSNE